MRTIAERETNARCPLYARGSEHETEGELHLPLRREAGRQITSDCRNAVRDCAIVDVRVEAAVLELRVVKQVENIGTNLECQALLNLDVLHHAHIPSMVAGTV